MMAASFSIIGSRLVGSVPELERDVTGLPMIEKLAAIMYGDGGR